MKKRLFTLLVFSALGLGLAFPPLNLSAEGEIPSSLSVGDTLNIPNKDLSFEGENKKADILITSPSGAVYTGQKLTIEEVGVYTLTYRAFFGDHEEKETHTIRVDYSACDLFKANDAVSLNRGSFSYDESFRGVKATFKNGGSLSFSKPIDLDKLGMGTPLVSFLIDPSAKGTADFSTFNVKIVDAYNENNYVTINCLDSGLVNTGGEAMYVKAGANDQTLYGYETDSKRHSNNPYGASIYSSFRAISNSGEYRPAEFYLDNSSLDVYGFPDFLSPSKKRKIVGLSSKADHSSDPFAGFSSSLAYINFEAKNFSSASGDVVFTSVGGVDLSKDVYLDNDAPEITIDLAGCSTVPDAVLNRPYPLFKASSFDEYDRDVKTDCKVYFLPANGGKIDVSIDDDAFIPTHVGEYEIVYSSHDRFFNESEERLLLSCGVSSAPLLGMLPYYKTETTVFSSLNVPSLDDFFVSGGSGLIKKNRLLIDPDGKTSSFASDSFTPDKTGVYTIRYQGFDYLNQAVISDLKITVKNLSEAVFLSEIVLPTAFIENEEASLPLVEAKMPGKDSPIDCPVDIYVNGEKLQGNTFVPHGSSVEISYVASSIRKEFTIPVVDVAQGAKQENYFYGEGEASLSETSVNFKSSGKGEISFLRALKPSELTLKFTLPNLGDNERASIKLSDGVNAVTLSVIQNGGKYLLSSPSNSYTEIVLDNDETIYLNYNNSTREISAGSGLPIMVLRQKDDGSSFNGFADSIRLSFFLEEGKSIAIYKINNQPFGYRGKNVLQDEVGPEISLPTLPAVKQKVGSTVVIPASKAHDVLNAVASFTLTLVKPDKSKVELDPTLSNSLTFEEYGFYRLEFVATDAKGNSSKTVRLFNVQESNAPVLELTSSLKDVYGVGEEIVLPTYSVSDDSSSYTLSMILLAPEYERIVLLKDDSGRATYYLDQDDYSSYRVSSTSFKLAKEGKYSLVINVRDQFYNITSKRVEFTVKGAN